MRKQSFILFCTLLTCTFCGAQLKPVYTFRQDDTVLKRKYCNEATEKKKTLIAGLKKDNSKDYKEAYESMCEVAEDLLQSSRAITDHAADNYIKAVAAKIINGNPELKALDLRVVFTRDIAPNAYSIGEGTIAFNAGLFVYLNNEAEIAMVLCHELAHYYLEHSKRRIDSYVRLKNSDSLKKEIKRLTKQEYGVAKELERIVKNLAFDISKHSRGNEAEADRVGLQFLKNTGYDGSGFITLMQVLDKVDDSAFFSPLNLQKALNFPEYPFKEKWIKKESVIFGALNEDDASPLTKKEKDSLKTHPDCLKRIDLLRDSAEKIKGRFFQVDEKLFNQLKQDLIPEILEELYRNENIGLSLYLSLQMLQENKHLPLAVYSIARDLNVLYESQKNHRLGVIAEKETRSYPADYNLLLRMIDRLRLEEIASLNYHFCRQYESQMKEYEKFLDEMNKAVKIKSEHQ